MSVYLEKGTKICRSRRGHNGFFYPDPEDWDTTAVRTKVIPMSWVGSEMAAVLITEDSFLGFGQKDRLIPVWVEKSVLVKE